MSLQRQVLRKLIPTKNSGFSFCTNVATVRSSLVTSCIFVSSLRISVTTPSLLPLDAVMLSLSSSLLESSSRFLTLLISRYWLFLIICFKKFISAPRLDFIDRDTGSNVPLSCIRRHLCVVTEHCDTHSYETCQERTCPQGRIRAGREVGSTLPAHVWHSRRSFHVGWHMVRCVQGELNEILGRVSRIFLHSKNEIADDYVMKTIPVW